MTNPSTTASDGHVGLQRDGHGACLGNGRRRGAEQAGAEVRPRRVGELAPQAAIEANPAWGCHLRDTADVPEASSDDLAWADLVAFGTPTRFGAPASQLMAFVDANGPLWEEGRLADKVYTAFTASQTAHGGQESTLLALSHVFYHWGGAARERAWVALCWVRIIRERARLALELLFSRSAPRLRGRRALSLELTRTSFVARTGC